MSYSYRQIAPGGDLAPVIDACWMREARPGTHRVLPDGCIDLIFASQPGGTRLFTSPLIEAPRLVPPATEGWFVGVRMKPAMSRLLLPVAPVECRDRAIDAAALDPGFARVEAQLRDCATPAAALAILRDVVVARVRAEAHRAPPRRVQHALALLGSGPPWLPAEEVARRLGISPRSLHREVLQWTGHAPKVLARIARMQRAVTRLRAGGAALAEVALDTGYADQPHMTRELRRLTGQPPSALVSGTFKTR